MIMSRIVFVFLLLSSNVFSAPDFFEIKKSALLSAASYASPATIAKRLQAVNYSLIHQAELPGTAVSYFLARSPDKTQYLSFRGTSNLENVLVDLDVSLTLDQSLNIQLHQGFSVAAKAVYEDVIPFLDKSQPIQTTGHSLGGAIAVILAMYLERDGYQLQEVITFGQPKVTNVAGARVFENLPLLRVVTPADIVPLVPPLSPLQLQNLDIYWHNGLEIILLAQKQYALTQGFKSMMRATKFVSALPDESNLKAHQIDTYLALIESNQESAQQVPYKMGISLFGLTLD
jgi:hypothetical protein